MNDKIHNQFLILIIVIQAVPKTHCEPLFDLHMYSIIKSVP